MLDLTTPLLNAVDLIWDMFATDIQFNNSITQSGIITKGAAPWDYGTQDQGVAIETQPVIYMKKDSLIFENDKITHQGSKYRVGVVSQVKVPEGNIVVQCANLYEYD